MASLIIAEVALMVLFALGVILAMTIVSPKEDPPEEEGIPMYQLTDEEYLKAQGLNREARRRIKKRLGRKQYGHLLKIRKLHELREHLKEN
jgi:hypothetical protein